VDALRVTGYSILESDENGLGHLIVHLRRSSMKCGHFCEEQLQSSSRTRSLIDGHSP
jgi:hypothetical protein